jgi:outer membrane immunogenic protein
MLHEGMTMMTINANASEMVTGRSTSTRLHLTRLGNCGAGLFAAIVGLLAVTDLAWGADLSTPPLAPVPYSWSGLYIGLNAGYTSAKVTETASGGGGTASSNLSGGIGGFQIGANYQTGALVLGFEADFDGTMTTKSVTGTGITGTAQIPWIGTLRGRVGYAFDRILLYVTAGGAATQLVSTVNVGAIGSASTTFTHGAWTAGGGLEAAITEDLSARVEYLYVDTGNINVAQVGPPVVTVTGRVQDNLVRAGVNYRLPVAW